MAAECGKEVVTVVRDDFFHDPFFKVAASSLLLLQFLIPIHSFCDPFLYLKDWWGDFEAPAGSWDKALQRQPSGRISSIQNHSNLKSINRRVTRHRLRPCLHVFHVSCNFCTFKQNSNTECRKYFAVCCLQNSEQRMLHQGHISLQTRAF